MLRQVTKRKVDLPEEVTGWMMLKRAGLTREQEQMVQTQIGSVLTLGAVEQSLLFGQDYQQVHVPHHLRRQQQQLRWKRPQGVHMTWDDDAAEEFFEAEESYYMDAEEEYDIQEQRRSVTSRNRRNGLSPNSLMGGDHRRRREHL